MKLCTAVSELTSTMVLTVTIRHKNDHYTNISSYINIATSLPQRLILTICIVYRGVARGGAHGAQAPVHKVYLIV